MNKLDFVQSLIISKGFDIMCITETWLTAATYTNELLPPGFLVYRRDRGSRGGGVLVGVSDTVKSCLFACNDFVELIVVKVFASPIFLLCCLYIPPGCSVEYLQNVICALSLLPNDEDVIITGDFNVPDMNWSALIGESYQSTILGEFIFEQNLVQLIDVSTHKDGNILDLVMTNSPERVTRSSVESFPCCTESDHYLISLSVNCNITLNNSREDCCFLDYARGNMIDLDGYLLDTDFSHILLCDDIDEIWKHIKAKIIEGCHLFIPEKKIRKDRTPKWFNSVTKHLSKCVRTARRQACRSPSEGNLHRLLQREFEFQYAVRDSKAVYEQQLVNNFSSNPQKLYHHLSSLSRRNSTQHTIIHESLPVTDPVAKATTFSIQLLRIANFLSHPSFQPHLIN